MHAGSPNPSQAESSPHEIDRRRHPRLTPHTTNYAVGDTVVNGRVAELNEILNISEEGMGIQALWPLTVGHEAEFRLDLSNPSVYAEVKGMAVWSEQSGRAGIQFGEISTRSRAELGAWLLSHRTGAAAALTPEPEQPDSDDPLLADIVASHLDEPHNTDYTSVLAALDAVRREVRSLGSDQEALLQLVATRAEAFARASGVAIALSDGAEMTCRAVAGKDGPPVGTRLQIGSGFSGECVRTGSLLHCRDTENDPLVDRESCRALAIRSMVAAPIRSADQVVGLIEVFSPRSNNFHTEDEFALQRLALIISESMARFATSTATSAEAPVDDEFSTDTAADLPIPQFSASKNGLLISAGITVLIAVFWLIGTWDSNRPGNTRSPSQLQSAPHRDMASQAEAQISGSDLEGLRRLAELGDSTAQFALGTRYATGQDVPQDFSEATRWFMQAAEQGNVISQAALAAYYSSGRGVPQDAAKAYFWTLVAQAGGDETSKARLATLESQLSGSVITEEQKEADTWLKQHPPVKKDTMSAP